MAAKSALDAQLQIHGGSDLESLSTQLLWVDEFMRLNTPDFWFVHLWLLGVSPFVIVLSVAGLLILAVVSGRKVLIRMKAEE